MLTTPIDMHKCSFSQKVKEYMLNHQHIHGLDSKRTPRKFLHNTAEVRSIVAVTFLLSNVLSPKDRNMAFTNITQSNRIKSPLYEIFFQDNDKSI